MLSYVASSGAGGSRRGCFRLERFICELTRETAGQEDPEKFSLHPIRKVQNFLNFTPARATLQQSRRAAWKADTQDDGSAEVERPVPHGNLGPLGKKAEPV